MAIATGTAIAISAGVGAAATVASTAVQASAAKKAENRARSDKNRLMDELDELENARKDVINPYEDVVSLDNMIVDNSGMISNPFENVGVATQAAEFQAEEADIALANTLDLLAGATALAQAALQSKRGISADIEKQEAKNQQLIAQGEQFMQQQQMSEAQRVQEAQMTEAQRLQQADVLGKEFVYGEGERRTTEALNRKQAQITGQAQAETASRQQSSQIIGSGIGAVGNIASSAITGLAKG
jgi:hypothetical protein